MQTIIDKLAAFVASCKYENIPPETIEDSRRILLDSIGCGIAGILSPKGKMGIDVGRKMGGSVGNATILGTSGTSSAFGAAFANGELINALDFDAILPPGHVAPYVIPVIMAVAEEVDADGKSVLAAVAIAHELSIRFSKAMDNMRDTKDGKVDTAKVLGYACTVFGAVAAAVHLKRASAERVAAALGLAAYMSPANSLMAWTNHTPTTTIKYTAGGVFANVALSAVAMAEAGHTGNTQILDDTEYGYARFIGTRRWEPQHIVAGLGEQWLMTGHSVFKPYPHARGMHSQLDALSGVINKHDIAVEEIEGIHVYVEGVVHRPAWMNRQIESVIDAQFSIPHVSALCAHRIPPGRAWQSPEVVFNPSILGLMNKVTFEVHPDYVKQLSENSASRAARVEVKARGQTFVGESRYPKGSRSPDPNSYMTTPELADKFRDVVAGLMPPAAVEESIDGLLNLERIPRFSMLTERFRKVSSA